MHAHTHTYRLTHKFRTGVDRVLAACDPMQQHVHDIENERKREREKERKREREREREREKERTREREKERKRERERGRKREREMFIHVSISVPRT